MKHVFLVVIIALISCCSAKKTVDAKDNKHNDSVSASGNQGNNYESDPGVPDCIKKLIRQFRQEDKQNPPRSVYRYQYQGKTVFFAPAICCDFFSDLYDDHCNLIAHPDGGFTGRGDGRAADFVKTRSAEKLIWADERK